MSNRARMLITGVLATVLLTVGSLATAMPAAAKTCYKNLVPPGQSGTSQYVEVVPTSCGNAKPPAAGSGGSNGTISHIGHGAAGVRSLSGKGAQGRAAAALAAAGAPAVSNSAADTFPGGQRSASGSGSGSGHGSGTDGASGASPAGSAGGALASAFGGSSATGLGVLMPVLMVGLLVAALSVGVFRHLRGGRSSA